MEDLVARGHVLEYLQHAGRRDTMDTGIQILSTLGEIALEIFIDYNNMIHDK